MSWFESIQNFITGDENSSAFTARTTFFSGLVFAIAGVGIQTISKMLGEWLND